MKKIEIKRVTLPQAVMLQDIGKQTFHETFAASNSGANMEKYLEEGFSLAKLRDELSHPDSEFYFAELDNKIIGYLKLNAGDSQTEKMKGKALEIERIYVLQQYHGMKVGQVLYEKAIEIAKDKDVQYVWLGVWEQNPRAIHFYAKNGFVEFDRHIFKLGNDEQTDIMMRKTIAPMDINLQPTLENEHFLLVPLQLGDFDVLYQAASDPKVWEQHPNKDRWRKDVFRTFFEGAIQSKGAFRIVGKLNGETIGSTRFYDHQATENNILIGYTFYSRNCWGKGINPAVKKLMLDYIFRFVEKVQFQIGAENVRSQIAIVRLGAMKISEQEVTYFGESPKLNFVYEICRSNWKM